MIFILVIIVVVLVTGIFYFNQLVRHQYLLREALSGMDVQLKRRHDLIPNIVTAVKGYKQYEQDVLTKVTSLRNQLTQSTTIQEKGTAENNLSQGLKTIFAIAEAYPDLKANQNFLDLQKNLVDIEDQIQMARRYYNGTVRDYNILVQSFPGNLVANLLNFKLADYFEIEYATDRQVPDVKMTD